MNKLFPRKHLNIPDLTTDMVWKDMVVSDVTVNVDFKDRLRTLIAGKIMVRVITKCQNAPGKMDSDAVFFVLPPGGE